MLEQMDDLSLMTALIMGEAEAGLFLGKLAVACVVRNRLADKRWPDTWAEVMLQKYQFSCFNADLIRPEITMQYWGRVAWRECRFAAFGVLCDYVGDITEGANHYYAASLVKQPYWADGHRHTVGVGNHLFYKL